MPARLGPRFALEAGFLIVLSVLAALADLSWQLIVAVMATAWLLTAAYELARWKEGPRLPVARRSARRVAPQPATGVDEATCVLAGDDLLAALSVPGQVSATAPRADRSAD